MKIPQWAPSVLSDSVEHYESMARDDKPQCQALADMWRRLLTRPEMESVWPWIVETAESTGIPDFGLVRRMGFFWSFGAIVERFYKLPRLSDSAYSVEMKEIASMAAALAAKVERFDASGRGHSPFNPQALLPEDIQELRWDIEPAQVPLFHRLTETPVVEYLQNLERIAATESDEQVYRLRVSRKAQDFRAYLIREVIAYFELFLEKVPPSKIAIICSIALEDPDITIDTVRGVGRCAAAK